MKLCPRWVAPNLLTLVGFLFCFGHFGLLALYDYDFRSATYVPGGDNQETVPGWAWFLVALFLFLAHTLDGIDGKQVTEFLFLYGLICQRLFHCRLGERAPLIRWASCLITAWTPGPLSSSLAPSTPCSAGMRTDSVCRPSGCSACFGTSTSAS